MLLTLIPKVFYADIQVGLDLFVRGLGFELLYQDPSISVLGRDGVKVYLMENAALAALDRGVGRHRQGIAADVGWLLGGCQPPRCGDRGFGDML